MIVLLCFAYIQSDKAVPGGGQKVDWGQKARDIAQRDPELKEITGDRQQLISGIVWEGSSADLYYRADNRIYNVSVDIKNETVTSIKEETDEKKLEWLRNISSSMTLANTAAVSVVPAETI